MPRVVAVVLMIGMVACCCLSLIGEGISNIFPFQGTEEILPTEEIGGEITAQNLNPMPDISAPLPEDAIPSSDVAAYETLEILQNNLIPVNDLRELAVRIGGQEDVPLTLDTPAPVYHIGEHQRFWVTNVDNNQNFQVDMVLRYATPHGYFWIQEGVRYYQADLVNLMETFEKHIYPTNREFFGSEWTPGIDHDPHLYILYVRDVGNIGGYFSANDSIHPLAHKYSNAHEMFIVSADYVGLDSEAAGVLAHEFQHMIHWYRDRNEESWVNEGFSVLAEFLNGYDVGMVDDEYIFQPDIQLTYWPAFIDSYPYYGSAFMFVNYFLNRFGEEATKTLVALPEDGLVGVDTVLAQLDVRDPKTHQIITADDVFADWVIANYVNDTKLEDSRYGYHHFPEVPKPALTEEINSCPLDWQVRTVNQYGVDYIGVNCPGNYVLDFQGASEVSVLPVNAHSGKYFFWSNKGSESDMILTRTFDLSSYGGQLTLEYWTWYDLEKDYDHVYLEISEDGEHWQILQTPSGTQENPAGNSYGWAYNGNSNGWIKENVDLSDFAGKQIQLRFEYVTDAAVNGEGFLLDDVSIPQIGYAVDFEQDTGGWEASGFVRIQNILPQIFRVSTLKTGELYSIEKRTIQPGETLSIPISQRNSNEQNILVVSGMTRFTHQTASYQFRIRP